MIVVKNTGMLNNKLLFNIKIKKLIFEVLERCISIDYDSNILMNRKKYIFVMMVLKRYFIERHYPLELVIVIMKCYDYGWIENYFEGHAYFDEAMRIEILKHGLGIDRIMFKFILPELPNGLTYKKFCVYDLIQCIGIEIGLQYVLQLDSEYLELVDKVYRKVDVVHNQNQNMISYMFDLTYFFSESSSDNNFHHLLPMDFKGIRLIDCKDQTIRLHLMLNKIYQMIDASDDVINQNRNILSKLELFDTTVHCHYIELCPNIYNLPKQNKTSIVQKFRTWHKREVNFSTQRDHRRFAVDNRQISKLIFCSENLDRIGYIYLKGDKRNLMSILNLGEYKRTYESKNNIALGSNIFVIDININIPSVDCFLCEVWMYAECDNFKISCIYDANILGVYKNDRFELQ